MSAVLQDFPTDRSTEILANYDQAIQVSDTCLVFVAATAGESVDRQTLRFDNNGDQLIQYVSAQCPNTIVVSHIVGPTNFESAAQNKNVTAILNAGLPGQESGASLLSLLDGTVSPSGKLVYTILQKDGDYTRVYTQNSLDPHSVFSERLLTDYRAADAQNLLVRYPFGHGLSYTSFAYSNIALTKLNTSIPITANVGSTAERLSPVLQVTATVKNTGSRNGSEVAQLYLSYPNNTGEPPRVLRGFNKTFLNASQSATVQFQLRQKDISIWNVVKQMWEIPAGQMTISVGGSSRNLPLSTNFTWH